MDTQDRRRVLLVAAPRGRQALTKWDAVAAEVQAQFREILGPDADMLDDLWHRLAHGLTRSPASAAGAT